MLDDQLTAKLNRIMQLLERIAEKIDPKDFLLQPPTPDRNSELATRRNDVFDKGFWPYYPRKVAKREAREAWTKKRPKTKAELKSHYHRIMNRMTELIDGDWKNREPDKIPYPATFINQEEW